MSGSSLFQKTGSTTTDVDRWTVTRLFDYLQETLGIGDFSGEPSEYHGWRMRQIGMIKRVMQRRGVSPAEMVMCAEYCKAHRIQPESHAGLLWHIDQARAWKRQRTAEVIQEDLDSAVAIEQERVLSDEEASRWVDMLLRATGPSREEVLTRWRKERSHL
jgi:hypothetical protein